MQIKLQPSFELTKPFGICGSSCLKLKKYVDQIITIHVNLHWKTSRNIWRNCPLHAGEVGLQRS